MFGDFGEHSEHWGEFSTVDSTVGGRREMNLIEAWKLSKEVPREERDCHWTFENFETLAEFVASITEEAALGEWGPKIIKKKVFCDVNDIWISIGFKQVSFGYPKKYPRKYASEGILELGKYKVTVEWEE